MADIRDLVRPPRRRWSRAGNAQIARRGRKAPVRRGPISVAEWRFAALFGTFLGLIYAGFPTVTIVEPTKPAGAPTSASFGLCHSGGGWNCVVDGDTFYHEGTKIRIADIDTPETHPARCAEEARLGEAATLRLRALLSAGPFTLAADDRDEDRHGRKLRVVMRDGESLGDTLVAEGLARPYAGGRRPWCSGQPAAASSMAPT